MTEGRVPKCHAQCYQPAKKPVHSIKSGSIGRAVQETVNDLSFLGKSQVFATELRRSRTGTEL